MTDETTPAVETTETVNPNLETTAPQEVAETVAPPMKFKFGFVILVDEEGGVFIEKDPNLLSIPVDREATLIEIRRYTSEILMDLQAQAAAEYTSLRVQQMFTPPAPPAQP